MQGGVFAAFGPYTVDARYPVAGQRTLAVKPLPPCPPSGPFRYVTFSWDTRSQARRCIDAVFIP